MPIWAIYQAPPRLHQMNTWTLFLDFPLIDTPDTALGLTELTFPWRLFDSSSDFRDFSTGCTCGFWISLFFWSVQLSYPRQHLVSTVWQWLFSLRPDSCWPRQQHGTDRYNAQRWGNNQWCSLLTARVRTMRISSSFTVSKWTFSTTILSIDPAVKINPKRCGEWYNVVIITVVRLSGHKKVQNHHELWYGWVAQPHTVQGDFGLGSP